MNLIERINKFLNKLFTKEKNSQEAESYELSIIDTSTLQIDENLTDSEKNEYQKLIVEIKQGDISTIITYGNDIAKTINHYMEISRKRINQNIEENKSASRLVSTEEVIKHKLKIIFNNSEIDNIIKELNELARKCEIIVLALKKVGEEELKKSKRKINLFSNKYDLTKVNSINNAISRLSSSIKIISMLVHSIQIEQYNCKIENDAIDKYLENNNPDENRLIANRVLNNTFDELKHSLAAISELSFMPLVAINNIKIDEINFDEQSISSKIDIIASAKKYLDLYVMKNKSNLFKEDGIFKRASKSLDNLWEELESDYYDWDLWAKKIYGTKVQDGVGQVNVVEEKYSNRLGNIERIISIFDEEIPEDFKEKFYKTKFYYKALYIETRKTDSTDVINTNLSEKEKNYYIKFLSEIIEKVHKQSQDGELLKFMDKNLAIKDIDEIITDYKRFVALLRIEKYGRDGLFTMIMYDHKYQVNYDEIHPDFNYRALNMEYRGKLNSISNDKLYFLKDETTLKQLYGTSSPFCLEVLKLWGSTEYNNRYNCFFGDYNNSKSRNFWEREENPTFTFRADFSIPRDILKKGIEEARNDENLRFIAQFSHEINRKIRMESAKQENDRLWNSKVLINAKYNEIYVVLSQFLAGFAYGVEIISNGKITKEHVMNNILQFYSIKTDEKGNLMISQFGEKANMISSPYNINQLVLYLSLHLLSSYYIDALKSCKNDKNSKFQIIDENLIKYYKCLAESITSEFSKNDTKQSPNQLDSKYIKFFRETRKMIKEKIKENSIKPSSEQLWNTEYIVFPSIKISLAELIASFSNNIEEMTDGRISKEYIRNQILNFHSIRRDGNLYHIVKRNNEVGKIFNFEKREYYAHFHKFESSSKDDEVTNYEDKDMEDAIFEITKFFISNILISEKELNKQSSEYRKIVSYLSKAIIKKMIDNGLIYFEKDGISWRNIMCGFFDSRSDYLIELFYTLPANGKANILRFPKQSIDFLFDASKDSDRIIMGYCPKVPIIEAAKIISNMRNNEQKKQNLEK